MEKDYGNNILLYFGNVCMIDILKSFYLKGYNILMYILCFLYLLNNFIGDI